MACPTEAKPLKPHRRNAHAQNHGMSPARTADPTVGIVTHAPIAMIEPRVAETATPCAKTPVAAEAVFADATKANCRPDHRPSAPRPHRSSLKVL